MKKKKESYDFSLWNKKSYKDVQRHLKRHGLNKTIKELRKSFGQEKIIAEYSCAIYTFPYFPGHIEIRENERPPFNETIHVIPLDKRD